MSRPTGVSIRNTREKLAYFIQKNQELEARIKELEAEARSWADDDIPSSEADK
jgi:BMFP domain-containing protein YqiC